MDNALENGKYRYFIQNDKSLIHVDWNDGFSYMGVTSNIFDGTYKYLSNLSHPSHWGQLQFQQAFNKIQPEYIFLACCAARFVVSILSFFTADLVKIEPVAMSVFCSQPYDSQKLMQFYNNHLR